MKYIFLSLATVSLIACGTSKKQPERPVSVEDYENPNTINNITAGRTIFENQCTLCHAKKNIDDYSYEEWEPIVENMSQKVNDKLKREEITPERQAQLMTYINYELNK